MDKHVEVLREMLECRAKWGEEPQAAALTAAIAALEAVESVSKACLKVRNIAEQQGTIDAHGSKHADGMRRAANIIADALPAAAVGGE